MDKLKKAQDYASQRGGVCLSLEYINNKRRLEWKCSNSAHPAWLASWDNVLRKKTWCKHCSGKNIFADGLKRAKNYAHSRGGDCLSLEYLSDAKKLEWKCSNPVHPAWMASCDNVLRKKTWCKHCADDTQKAKKDVDGLKKAQEYALFRGGQCLSLEYINQNTKLEWKCSNLKHASWFAVAKIRLTNSWCRHCYEEKRLKND